MAVENQQCFSSKIQTVSNWLKTNSHKIGKISEHFDHEHDRGLDRWQQINKLVAPAMDFSLDFVAVLLKVGTEFVHGAAKPVQNHRSNRQDSDLELVHHASPFFVQALRFISKLINAGPGSVERIWHLMHDVQQNFGSGRPLRPALHSENFHRKFFGVDFIAGLRVAIQIFYGLLNPSLEVDVVFREELLCSSHCRENLRGGQRVLLQVGHELASLLRVEAQLHHQLAAAGQRFQQWRDAVKSCAARRLQE